MMYYRHMDSPVGRLLVAGDDGGLRQIRFPKGNRPDLPESHWVKAHNPLEEAILQLEAYFAGKLKKFSLNLCLDVTPFQKKVLTALQQIPYGETASYGEVAEKIGNPLASRAVGQANARNPIPIIIPCHRVVGSNGTLTGFGGGVAVKQALLNLEKRHR
jgi:methylated-DNA-[protein]-cysteine S-methyltransferase